jgi:ribokinase
MLPYPINRSFAEIACPCYTPLINVISLTGVIPTASRPTLARTLLMATPKICVVGSSNLDMNSYVTRFPAPGETIHGQRFTTGYGGKGANQAVMAARLGAEVTFVGKVGSDLFGRDMQANFRNEGIDIRHVQTTDEAASGVAVITIDATGMNSIIVIPGANGLLTAEDVEAARPAIEGADVLVCQLEVPMTANLAAAQIARQAGKTIIFNPAPIGEEAPDELLGLCDIVCPNENESTLLTGQQVTSLADAETAARMLLERGARQVIVTLGERGSLLVDDGQVVHVPAPSVRAVDTTGAGDAFVGTLAYFLAAGAPVVEAMRRATQVAAISVQQPGTQTSYPRAMDLPEGLLTVAQNQ